MHLIQFVSRSLRNAQRLQCLFHRRIKVLALNIACCLLDKDGCPGCGDIAFLRSLAGRQDNEKKGRKYAEQFHHFSLFTETKLMIFH